MSQPIYPLFFLSQCSKNFTAKRKENDYFIIHLFFVTFVSLHRYFQRQAGLSSYNPMFFVRQAVKTQATHFQKSPTPMHSAEAKFAIRYPRIMIIIWLSPANDRSQRLARNAGSRTYTFSFLPTPQKFSECDQITTFSTFFPQLFLFLYIFFSWAL